MDKIRFGVVGLGHRGRHMARLAVYIYATRNPAATNPLLVHSPWRKTLGPIRYRCPEFMRPDPLSLADKNLRSIIRGNPNSPRISC